LSKKLVEFGFVLQAASLILSYTNKDVTFKDRLDQVQVEFFCFFLSLFEFE